MKKHLYKYPALSVIVEILNEKAVALRNSVEYTKEHYKDEEDGIPTWAQDLIDKETGIADFIDEFISKL